MHCDKLVHGTLATDHRLLLYILVDLTRADKVFK
jgi:hypothetical protein